jgi:hypothetical protein
MFAILPYPPRKTFVEVRRAITCVERRVVRADLEFEVRLKRRLTCSRLSIVAPLPSQACSYLLVRACQETIQRELTIRSCS